MFIGFMLGYRYNNDRATYPNSADLWLRLPSPLGLKKICGRTACSFKLSEDERSLIVEDFALFLRELHAIPIEYANTWNVPYGSFRFTQAYPYCELKNRFYL